MAPNVPPPFPSGPGGPYGWHPMSLHPSPQVQEALMDGTQSISRLREDVQSLTQWVESGAMVEKLEGGSSSTAVGTASALRVAGASLRKLNLGNAPSASGDVGRSSDRIAADEKTPSRWSAVLPHAHLKLGGMVGALVSVPLVPLFDGTGWGNGRGCQQQPEGGREAEDGSLLARAPTAASDTLASAVSEKAESAVVPRGFLRGSVEWLRQGTASRRLLAAPPRSPSTASFLSGGGAPFVKPFASGGALLQLGSFQRGCLDFTRILAKVSRFWKASLFFSVLAHFQSLLC